MSKKLEWTRLPVINSRGPRPDAHHFRHKDQVLVRFKSGWLTIGSIVAMPNSWELGPDKLLYLAFKDVRHSNWHLLAGQGCECPIGKGHREDCKLSHSGLRRKYRPNVQIRGLMQANAQVFSVTPAQTQAINTAMGMLGTNQTWSCGKHKRRKTP